MSKTGKLVRHEHKSNHLAYYEPLPETVYLAYKLEQDGTYYQCACPIPGIEDTWFGNGSGNYWGTYLVTPGRTFAYWYDTQSGFYAGNGPYLGPAYPQRAFVRQGNTNVWLNADATIYSGNYNTNWCIAAVRWASPGVFEYFQYQGRNANASKLYVVMQSAVWSEKWASWDPDYRLVPNSNGGLESVHYHYVQKFTGSTLFGTYNYVGSVGWSDTYCFRWWMYPSPITIQRTL